MKVTVLLSIAEQGQVERLAEDEGVPGRQMIRMLVNRTYVRWFGEAKPHATPAMLRGLVDDLTGRAHCTAGNIAERLWVWPQLVVDALARLAKRRGSALLRFVGGT